jgi:membrane protein implicated in regulation of membrane protease activity
MAAVVKQIRVLGNVARAGGLCVLGLWLLRDHLREHCEALALGLAAGMVMGLWRWRCLSRKIARRDRRYERNKIFVNYLTVVEVLIATVAYSPYLSIPIAIGLLAAVLFGTFAAHWWAVLAASVGLMATAVVAGYVVWYEWCHGRLYYQYNSESWSGAEGLLYQTGLVVKSLTPAGKVTIQGVLWNAVSISGERVEVGEQVEVISIERLTLHVDRLPM